jgi:hypothetical protein
MPDWIVEEVDQAKETFQSIDEETCPRRRSPAPGPITILFSDSERFQEGLISTRRALAIRQLYSALGFDEHRPFRWRLEHKLVQALVLNRYCPGVVPVTRGLGRKIREVGPAALRRSLHDEFPDGFYIKPSLGDSSGEGEMCDRTHVVLKEIEGGNRYAYDAETIWDETYIIQERIPIKHEFRVQSIEDQVIEDLTFWRYGRGNIPGIRDAPNEYLRSVLDRLPSAVIAQSLIGWDVAKIKGGGYVVIEMNSTGFHPVFRRGFQCSGYFQDEEWGASMVARLMHFIEVHDGVPIAVQCDHPVAGSLSKFYADIDYWQNVYRAEAMRDVLSAKPPQ